MLNDKISLIIAGKPSIPRNKSNTRYARPYAGN